MSKKLLLPQNDLNGKTNRDEYLKKQREKYKVVFNFNKNIAQVERVDKLESSLQHPLFALKSLWVWLVFMVLLIPALLKKLFLGFPFKQFIDYFFYGLLNYPYKKAVNNFASDDYFGMQRVAGVNPLHIQGLSSENPLPENFKAAANTVALFTDRSYEEALTEGRLYLADYSVLQPMADRPGTTNGYKKYPTIPIALFYRRDNGLLKPLAIQLYANKPTGPDNILFTPDNGNHWLMARFHVQCADVNLQDTWVHAVYHHYVIEGILLGTYRNFAQNHPLHALLDPHMQVTLLLNHFFPFFEPEGDSPLLKALFGTGQTTFLNEMFFGDTPSIVDFVGEGMRKYRFQEMAFPKDIQRRNVTDSKLYYPYRDDGKLVWEAIAEFVENYVNLHYSSDRDVIDDTELQAWGREVGGALEDGNFGIPEFPTAFQTRQEISETLTNTIFIATARHNCLNYNQYQFSTFVPNNPFAIYAPPTMDLEKPLFLDDLIGLLPPYVNTLIQSFLFFLTNAKVNRLGEYPLGNFDSSSQSLIKDFQRKLKEVTLEVDKRNIGRTQHTFPYELMNPKNIPNSITA